MRVLKTFQILKYVIIINFKIYTVIYIHPTPPRLLIRFGKLSAICRGYIYYICVPPQPLTRVRTLSAICMGSFLVSPLNKYISYETIMLVLI